MHASGRDHSSPQTPTLSCPVTGEEDKIQCSDGTPTHRVPLVAPDDGVVVTIGSPDPPALPLLATWLMEQSLHLLLPIRIQEKVVTRTQ